MEPPVDKLLICTFFRSWLLLWPQHSPSTKTPPKRGLCIYDLDCMWRNIRHPGRPHWFQGRSYSRCS